MSPAEEASLWNISTFDEAIDYAADLIGSDFKHAIGLAFKISETPSDYTGSQATIAAMRLAAYRVRIGQAAQHWKLQSAASKKPHDRLIKDSYMCMYDSLLELINTLKLQARYEKDVVTSL